MHPPIKEAIEIALTEILIKGQMADKFLPFFIRSNKKWGSRDRRTIAAAGFDIVRHAPFLQSLNGFTPFEFNHTQFHALIDSWEQLGINGILEAIENSTEEPHIKFSMPLWIYDKLQSQHSDSTQQICNAFLTPGPICIRINSRIASTKAVLDQLSEAGFTSQPTDFTDTYLIQGKGRINQTIPYINGWIDIQDYGSQKIVHDNIGLFENSVADVCAGEGGKTMQLANSLPNTNITAFDIDNKRILKNANRAELRGFSNIKHSTQKKEVFIAQNKRKFNSILIDAPCSGIGTVKRQADLKYQLSAHDIQDYTDMAQSCLSDYAQLLEPNGTIVFATCSLFQEENQLQIDHFCKKSAFELIKQQIILPTATNDGFYYAVLGQ